jgi:tripartite-type tricarboxylate transporter receptor subunit TctC
VNPAERPLDRPPVSTAGHKFSRRHLLAGGVGALAAGALAGCAQAVPAGGSRFPIRPVQIIVAYAAGGGTDVGVRILQPYLEEALGESVTVVNRPGGSGWVGWGELAQARPDGHTIGMLNTPNIMSGYLNPELDIQHDLSSFVPLVNHVTDYGVVAVNAADGRFPDIASLVEHARANRLTGTSTGVGSDDHMSALALNDRYDTQIESVHSGGAAENVTAVLGGNIDVLFANVGEVVPLVRDQRLRALAVMSDQPERSPFLPDVPTLSEAGFPDVYSWSSRGFAGPAGLPPDVARVLEDALTTAIRNPQCIDQLGQQGLQVDLQPAPQYAELLRADEARVAALGDSYVW